MKYRLYDIDVVINKTLVFGVSRRIHDGHLHRDRRRGRDADRRPRQPCALAVAAAVVTIAFQPVRRRVQRFANRLVYGRRATRTKCSPNSPTDWRRPTPSRIILPRTARVIGRARGSARAEVWLRTGSVFGPAARFLAGAPPRCDVDGEAIPAGNPPRAHQGELIGEVSSISAPASPDPTEVELIEDLASQAGLVLRNGRLIDDLRSSRQRLVAAQDEERRSSSATCTTALSSNSSRSR